MKVLVTGAAGFIGSHLCERLLGEGWQIIGVDNFDDFYEPQIKRSNIAGCLENKNFQLVETDIRDRDAMEEMVGKDIDIIVHLAARAGVRPSIAQPLLYADVNVNGTTVLLEAAKKHKVDKFIFASSSSVYGNNEKVPFSEDDNVDFPISPYAATKKAGELICHTYHHLYGISLTCLRYFTVYGPRQRPDLAIHKFASLIEQGKTIPVYGDGTMSRDFTYIDDIINGTVAAIEKCAGFNIYNLGESRPITVNDLVSEIEKALGKKAVKEHVPPQPGDVERTYADVTKAIKELGYNPTATIGEGLAQFVKWLRKS
ncbi:MAG: NAD-dependent epimerase/dehydratase family protein [Phycisphaerae bacterium]|nr:NAD-dependent epimerase/dehydratase family protein [Phycisphaerae bacterium]NIP52959.1 NAD-dependent epimerase/dehydratase family protein [Phycisphaerae bacterium]NIS52010.1 NAD-dependent epimerase/dehydratase family protein [Phycisphaerae bacterium]NIU09524.1 NAD-dependent epimerase/dehydratase family protein [Phycisphaerae bacterium]NIU58175.1 NAD-dependent epimerase/dehydratase family protein [Phycisphaerae bacterium]